KKVINNVSSTDENTPAAAAAAKPSRRRFFSRKNNKLKKQVPIEDDTNQNSLNEQTNEKLPHRSKSLKESHSTRSSPPPPD
ncbi:unnamed protein product, partial [Rotaria magnacalcarata]